MSALLKSPAGVAGNGGMGMKWKKMFEPKTTNMSPNRTRAMMVTTFMPLVLNRPQPDINRQRIQEFLTPGIRTDNQFMNALNSWVIFRNFCLRLFDYFNTNCRCLRNTSRSDSDRSSWSDCS